MNLREVVHHKETKPSAIVLLVYVLVMSNISLYQGFQREKYEQYQRLQQHLIENKRNLAHVLELEGPLTREYQSMQAAVNTAHATWMTVDDMQGAVSEELLEDIRVRDSLYRQKELLDKHVQDLQEVITFLEQEIIK